MKPIAEAYELLEDNDNQQLHTLQTFTTQTINSKGSTSQSATCPLGDGRHQIFKCPIFIAQSPEERQMTTRNSGLCFNCLNKDHRIANCPSKKNCQHSNCNKRHNTSLHRDFQIAGSSSHLTGRQGFRTNNRNQPLEASQDKSPSHKGTTASVHVTQKVSTTTAFKRTQKPKTTEQRHISQQPLCRFYQSTCTINTALQQCMLYLTVEVRQASSQRT